MASLPRTLFRPARHALTRSTAASKARAPRALGVNMSRSMSMARGMATVGNAPPMEPHKQRPRDIAVGELEGVAFKVEPLRRVGEDEKTMRARLVDQSRKRGILETDLLLSTFADEYLPNMTLEQMTEYDLFLDENDWDIYYWATQEEPSTTSTSASTSTSTSSSSSSSSSSTMTTDTSSASYGSAAETATATATPNPNSSSSSSSSSSTPTPTTTGGIPLSGEHIDTKAAADTADAGSASSSSSSSSPPPPTPYAGEWAQTVGTFKPAYRPVPTRWRDSAALKLLREHVRARSGEKGGMAFMPALRS
ncbi:Flavinator of succinate dehydrogenase-domain-containing protein [Xylaria sp. FL1042]|nr:Flavinator of succinate dehydrogenase-domain-containing protein [Xylaria sp. FL1042]